MRCRSLGLLLLAGLMSLRQPAEGQDKKKPEKKVEPKVLLVMPLGAAPGATSKLIIRGSNLDQAKEIKLKDGTAKILNKSKSAPPDKLPPEIYGDSQLEVEVKLDEKAPSSSIAFTVVTPEGETAPHGILVETQAAVVKEKEPNEGFRQAQAVTSPCVIEGRVERQRDVDVFRLEGKAGQQLVAEVMAKRHGSALDALLTLYDSAGNQVASSAGGSVAVDGRLTAKLPADGVYFLSLIDVHDSGGALHVYRLAIK